MNLGTGAFIVPDPPFSAETLAFSEWRVIRSERLLEARQLNGRQGGSFMSTNDTRQSLIGIAQVSESVFPLTRFLVPRPDGVTGDLDGQCIETKKPESGHETAPGDVGGF